ncbi:MAG TPA: hypothetical protein VEY10_18585 [Flavisolibacter sp.]|jgi:hypothetical protein|nr:hypothetical protein [Flavisolibacter sp.]
MSIAHGRFQIVMSQKALDIAYVRSTFQEMCGITVSKGVNAAPLKDANLRFAW